MVLSSLSRHRSGMVGLIIILAMALIALISPVIAPYDPLEMHAEDRFHPPSSTYLMGTDEFGRDILSRVLIGSRVAFTVGLVSIGIATLVGASIGMVVGYTEGAADSVIMRIFDALMAFPAILLAIIILAVLGPGSQNAILAIVIVNIPIFARLARANVLVEKNKDYVDASVAIGAQSGRIIFRNILPNAMPTILVLITVSLAAAVLLESALSFLGLGTPLPAPSWGSMLSIGRGYLYVAPWYSIFPGVAIALLVMGFYLLGDGLRDARDPRRQKLK
ncbi:MAG: ABC transporter permease [Proteobacteria bacterium]|nr:ABC transporter permease [Pseudomonadota bacterium]